MRRKRGTERGRKKKKIEESGSGTEKKREFREKYGKMKGKYNVRGPREGEKVHIGSWQVLDTEGCASGLCH